MAQIGKTVEIYLMGTLPVDGRPRCQIGTAIRIRYKEMI